MLKPDYKHGLISVGAENLILKALDSELASKTKETAIGVNMAMVSELNTEGKRGTYTKAHDAVMEAHRLRCLNWKEPATRSRADIDSLVNLYYALEKAGIIKNNPVNEI